MATGQSNGALILIVEDEPFLRMAAADFVGEAGFTVVEASNADEAVMLLETRGDIRLIFTDIDMPLGSMNGLKLAAAVRDRWPPIRIIIVSGHGFPEKTQMPFGARFFSKPYDETRIVDVMHEMLEAA